MSASEPRVIQFGRVHVALGYAMANSAMIEVPDGYVVVDTLPSLTVARRVKAEFDRRSRGPVSAIIYTHSHTDHVQGTAAFSLPGTPIWAHERFFDELQNLYRLSRSSYRRAARQFGYGLPAARLSTCGIGPPLELDHEVAPPLIVPTHTFREATELQFGDVTCQLHSAPGETPDQIFLWLPDERVLFAADNVYKAFPNLYAIRGVRPRPVDEWISSLDRMRYLDPPPETMILGHTEPVAGAERIHEVLTAYRDAIAFVHDSVVRLINEERTPDDMVRKIRLPPHLRNHPYLKEVYGTLADAIRGIYAGYIGWFDGAAVNLESSHPADIGARLAKMVGGSQKLISVIDSAFAEGDLHWATWLSDRLLAAEPHLSAARRFKKLGLQAMADRSANPLHRHWYLSEAAELEQTFQLPAKPRFNSETIAEIPIEVIMRILPQRLDPVTSAKVTTSIGFDFTDSGKRFTFLVRRGVGEMVERLLDSPELTIRGTEGDFKRLVIVGERSKLQPEFWQKLDFRVPPAAGFAPFRKLRQLMQFGKIMRRP